MRRSEQSHSKIGADSKKAETNWHWYERVPTDSAAQHDAAGVVADGLGSVDGPPKWAPLGGVLGPRVTQITR
jgi:hypothetical protein